MTDRRYTYRNVARQALGALTSLANVEVKRASDVERARVARIRRHLAAARRELAEAMAAARRTKTREAA
jgi:hypothetical protein